MKDILNRVSELIDYFDKTGFGDRHVEMLADYNFIAGFMNGLEGVHTYANEILEKYGSEMKGDIK